MGSAVYDTLWVALLGMALSSLGFSNALAVVILRKRFAKPPPFIPLQKAINVGLKLGLGLFVVSWTYAFGVGMKAVARALMNHDFIPVLFLFFSPLISLACSWSLFGIALRARSQEVEELATEIHTLHATKAASEDWSDAWRAREVEAMKSQLATDPERINGWLKEWYAKRLQRFRGKALRAVLILGEPSYSEVLAMFQKNNVEDMKRWSLVTGKDMPT